MGNALEGAPFSLDATMRLTYSGRLLDLFNPFALLSGFISVAMVCMHGAAYLAAKTEERVAFRARIAGFAAAGLDAIEAYHSDHDSDATARYVNLADALGLAVSGGSDYHADDSHGGIMLGTVSLPRGHFDRLISSQPAGRRLRAK